MATPASPPIVFEHVGKRFGATVVLSDVHFRSDPGELVVLVGPSGCGKSTLMRLVAGLETLSEGAIYAGERRISELPPHERGVGMVFQSYALYPHLSVRENLAFPLYVKKVPREEQEREVRRVAEMLSLGPLLDRLPRQLSGGQRQRVAIGRCLVRKPDIYCFDEPLSNLDAALRAQIRVDLKGIQRELKRTTLYVTHDQIEAMTMADRIVVLHRGVLQQVGRPEELYVAPKNTFVARFIGSPAMSLIRGEVADGVFRSGTLTTPLRVAPGQVTLGVRAEDVLVSEDGEVGATVKSVEPVGETGYLHLEVPGMRIDAASLGAPGSATETPRAALLTASIPGRDAFSCEVGRSVRVSIRPGRARAFDPESGEALALDEGT